MTFYDLSLNFYRKIRSVKNRIVNYYNNPIVILIYHRVAELDFDPELLSVKPANFRQHVEFLQSNYRIIRLEDDWRDVEGPAIVITFDDGYADNYCNALPILEELGVPATFFITTGHLDSFEVFWWHHLEIILQKEKKLPPKFILQDPQLKKTWKTDTPENRQQFYSSFSTLLKQVDTYRRTKWMEQFIAWSAEPPRLLKLHRAMNTTELRELATSHVATLGAHTVTHPVLSALSAEDQYQEIFTSKKELEKICNQKIELFSYPFGMKRHYNKTTISLCRKAGFKKAVANFSGQVHHWTDSYQLPRHLVRDWNLDVFRNQIKQFWTR